MGPRPPYKHPVKVTRGLVCINSYYADPDLALTLMRIRIQILASK